jgi:uncharacterized membrane-anchored protein YhcB (DUF1043 family)
MFWIGLIIGLVLETIFSAVIIKWLGRAKKTAQELAHDVEAEANKFSKKL